MQTTLDGMTRDHRLWVTDGSVDLIDEIADAVSRVGTPATLDIIVTSAGHAHCARLAKMRRDGRISRIRIVLNHGTISLRESEGRGDADKIIAALGIDSVRAIRTHAKAFAVHGPNGSVGVITSANLNRNNRPEQYESADHLAGAISTIAGAIFAHTPPGIDCRDGADAYSGMDRALDSIRIDGVHVHRADDPITVAQLSRRDAELFLVERVGVAGFIESALKIAGRGAAVDACTWGLTVANVRLLDSARCDGRIGTLSLGIPARLGLRVAAAPMFHAAMALIPDAIWWTPTHAKIIVIEGPSGSITITGGANFMSGGQMDMVHVRRGDPSLAAMARRCLDMTLREQAPPMPSAEQLDAARQSIVAAPSPGAAKRKAALRKADSVLFRKW